MESKSEVNSNVSGAAGGWEEAWTAAGISGTSLNTSYLFPKPLSPVTKFGILNSWERTLMDCT